VLKNCWCRVLVTRLWSRGHVSGLRCAKSKATNVGLSQRVYIIVETCLNSFNRPQTAVYVAM